MPTKQFIITNKNCAITPFWPKDNKIGTKKKSDNAKKKILSFVELPYFSHENAPA